MNPLRVRSGSRRPFPFPFPFPFPLPFSLQENP